MTSHDTYSLDFSALLKLRAVLLRLLLKLQRTEEEGKEQRGEQKEEKEKLIRLLLLQVLSSRNSTLMQLCNLSKVFIEMYLRTFEFSRAFKQKSKLSGEVKNSEFQSLLNIRKSESSLVNAI